MESAIDRRRPNDLFSFISKSSVGFLLICAFFISGAFAQSESGSAAIEGTITDANGAVVAGASVTIRNVETGLERTATTDDGGRFTARVHVWTFYGSPA